MAFKGSLSDMSVVDVLQLLHVSVKTGVLHIYSGEMTAILDINAGHIVGCKHPDPNMATGMHLLEMGAITTVQLQDALQQQENDPAHRKPLVSALIGMGLLDEATGWQALEKLIEKTVVEIVGWQTGRFVFEMGNLKAKDDFRHMPESIMGSESEAVLV